MDGRWLTRSSSALWWMTGGSMVGIDFLRTPSKHQRLTAFRRVSTGCCSTEVRTTQGTCPPVSYNDLTWFDYIHLSICDSSKKKFPQILFWSTVPKLFFQCKCIQMTLWPCKWPCHSWCQTVLNKLMKIMIHPIGHNDRFKSNPGNQCLLGMWRCIDHQIVLSWPRPGLKLYKEIHLGKSRGTDA